MKGQVRSFEPIIQIPVLGSRGQQAIVDAVLDTGATCALTLPPNVIRDLGLHWKERSFATLAGNVTVVSHTYLAQILWNGEIRSIEVHQLEGDPLLGNKLLEGYRIEIDLIEGGAVEVTPLNRNHHSEEQHDA